MITKLKHFYSSTHNNVFRLSAINIFLYSTLSCMAVLMYDIKFTRIVKLVVKLFLLLSACYSGLELFRPNVNKDAKELNFLKTSTFTGIAGLLLMATLQLLSMF